MNIDIATHTTHLHGERREFRTEIKKKIIRKNAALIPILGTFYATSCISHSGFFFIVSFTLHLAFSVVKCVPLSCLVFACDRMRFILFYFSCANHMNVNACIILVVITVERWSRMQKCAFRIALNSSFVSFSLSLSPSFHFISQVSTARMVLFVLKRLFDFSFSILSFVAVARLHLKPESTSERIANVCVPLRVCVYERAFVSVHVVE